MSDVMEPLAPPTVRPKRKYTRRKPVAAKPQAERPKEKSIFDGMSEKHSCAFACTPASCVITHDNTCGSPLCGGPRADRMGNSGIMTRYAQAKLYLAHDKVDKRSR